MTTISPIAHATFLSEKLTHRADLASARFRKKMTHIQQYRESTNVYELRVGFTVFETKQMTGSEAVDANKTLRLEYADDVSAEIDAGVPFGQTKSRMKRWYLAQVAKN